jgi:serine protease Do
MSKKHYIIIIFVIIITNVLTIYIYDKGRVESQDMSIVGIPTTRVEAPFREDVFELSFGRRTVITEAVRMIEPAVVSVNVMKTEIVRRNTTFLEYFLDFYGLHFIREVQSIATGVLFRADGYIITNSHVVEHANQITVVMSNNQEFDAILVGMDILHDIAILKIEGDGFPYARLGTSSDLIIGEWSIAVGNPFGFLMRDSKPSVSVGVISALGRNFSSLDPPKVYKSMIQTDAAINPGNSGGPLVNVYGEVIGINSFIFTQSGGSVGIGFAIPIDRVVRISYELINYGRVREVFLGFMVQEITRTMASQLRLRSMDGVIVSGVENDSPADQAGLRRGDIIIRIDDINIRNSNDARIGVSDLTPGEQANFVVIREGREMQMVLVGGEFW